MNNFFQVKDSRGRESRTLLFVSISWFVVVMKFAIGGLWGIPEMSGIDFGVAVTGILAVWVGREWGDKTVAATVTVAKIEAIADGVTQEAVDEAAKQERNS